MLHQGFNGRELPSRQSVNSVNPNMNSNRLNGTQNGIIMSTNSLGHLFSSSQNANYNLNQIGHNQNQRTNPHQNPIFVDDSTAS